MGLGSKVADPQWLSSSEPPILKKRSKRRAAIQIGPKFLV
jgi:hypothetical protein